MSLGDELVARIGRASLADLVHARFVHDDRGPADGAAEHVTDALVTALVDKNQFAAEPALVAGVDEVVRRFFAAVVTDREPAFAALQRELEAHLVAHLGESPREVVGASYTPELQLAVLGLDALRVQEPVLDVGAGSAGKLVAFLRALGKDAHGLDARAETALVTRGSWLTHDYGRARFGTVISHMAFTLHFMHQEMKRSALAYDYGRAYMRILASLVPGGTFAYIPGLPFLEAMLPAAFEVVRAPLPIELVSGSVERVQGETGLVLDAATHVHRLRA